MNVILLVVPGSLNVRTIFLGAAVLTIVASLTAPAFANGGFFFSVDDFNDGDWLNAVASYNSGEGNVRRAV